jgi:tRNA(Ser,Leu) C12 N-acetylase TAN1
MRVDDLRAFLEGFDALVAKDESLANSISRVVPVTHTFQFQSPEEFERKAWEIAREWVPALKGASFHVRMHRRGFKGRLSSQVEERFLDRFLLERLEEENSCGQIDFEDPDYIIAVESVGQQAGLSLWTREDLERFSLLRLD